MTWAGRDIDDPEQAAIADMLKRVDDVDPAARKAVQVLASIVRELPVTEDMLFSPQPSEAWRTLRECAPDTYMIYRAQVGRKCGRAIVDLLDHHLGPPNVAPRRRLALLTPAQMCVLPMPPDLIEGVLPSQGVAVCYGPPGGGKSAFVEHIVNSLSVDRPPFADRRYRRCASLVIAAEGNRRARVAAWCKEHDTPPDSLQVRYVQQGVDLRAPHGDIDQVLALIDRTESEIGALGLVVIDTLARTFGGGSENDSADMGAYLANLQRIAERTGGLVFVIHHAGKDASRGARGHGSLLGAADAELFIERNGDLRTVTVTKMREGQDGTEISFNLKIVDLGWHPDPDAAADGKRLNAVVIQPVASGASSERSRVARVPPGATVALQALKSALARFGEYPAGMAMVERNLTVDVGHWRAEYENSRPISADDPDPRKAKQSRRMAFNRAQDQLQAARIVGTNAGKWWVL